MGQKLFKGLQEIGICYCLILGRLLIPYALASVGHYILNLNLVMSFTFWAWVMMLPTACVLAIREAGNIMHGGGEAFLTALLFLSAGAGLSAYLIVLLFPKSVEELTLEMQGIFLIGFPLPYSFYRFVQSLAVLR